MTTLAFNSLSKSTARSPFLASIQAAQAGKRWLHQSPARQAIMMPAMSPYMTEGTITRWKKREGEAFTAGEVLLQIESDIAMIDVEAQSAGIIGKILLPDGSTNVPVEQVIALVVKDDRELANLSAHSQAQAPTPPPYNPIPSPTSSRSIPSPLHVESFNQLFMPPGRRSPSLFEMHAMGHSPRHTNVRGMMMSHSRGPKLSIIPPSPQMNVQTSYPSSSLPSSRIHTLYPRSATETPIPEGGQDVQMDGAAIRRMIVSNLARAPLSAATPRNRHETADYFDGLI